ncbi:histidine kinase-like ATPase, C-terminal domain-containing protein [Artemisia annua]|uniref:Histidine kinase-like ATPase, C-terminal domain-containing protein n=1 Tax=Artemisia annua TaxID=35608 RepID=A0A2U1LA81_ARTAN|nr:histidine kinase-like ATPase, C-terminal domain-containing protein [Artemisia annua]
MRRCVYYCFLSIFLNKIIISYSSYLELHLSEVEPCISGPKRHTEVSSKMKNRKKVFVICLQRGALIRGSGSKQTWRTSGSVRDPSDNELELSPGGSFPKVKPWIKTSLAPGYGVVTKYLLKRASP